MSAGMNLVFIIYSYFPHGGQQRDFMRILNECRARGHNITVYTLKWTGDKPDGVTIHLVPVKALTRTRLYKKFTRWVESKIERISESPNEKQNGVHNQTIVGFNKMPGLDVYYAADPCFAEMAATQRGSYYQYSSRFKHFSAYEKAVFGGDSATEILYLSPQQRAAFKTYYPECESRLHALPAGLAEDRRLDDRSPAAREARKKAAREKLKNELNISETATLVIQIGSGFKVKGVDRALRAIASLPRESHNTVHYLLVGSGKPASYLRLAKKLNIANKVTIVEGRDDVPDLLAAADLMLHPAYRESAGYTLLEAIVAGLPVLATETCGYAYHIVQANAGAVCPEPFSQASLNKILFDMLEQLPTAKWSANGLAYGAEESLYTMPQAAADFIERFESGTPRG
jgi:UDP-glucose:(heptosyl)LPS alpha-1,3-glucosyltransferase